MSKSSIIQGGTLGALLAGATARMQGSRHGSRQILWIRRGLLGLTIALIVAPVAEQPPYVEGQACDLG
jgi:hypothetical protein